MSSAPPSTLQCFRCAGYFRAAAPPGSRVRCPHCAWTASASEFRPVRDDELASAPAAAPQARVEVAGGAWVQQGKYLQFACPHCQRPMRMLDDEVGGLTDCPHCGLEIVSPDPATGTAARLSDASLRRLGGGGRRRTLPRRAQGAAPLPAEQAPSLGEAEDLLADMQGAAADPRPGSPPFAGPGDAASRRAPPVRMLGLEQLGAAFKARDEMEAPDPLGWDATGSAPSPDRVFSERRGRWFALVGAMLLGCVGAFFVVSEMRRRSAPVAEAQELPVAKLRQEAFGVARAAAGAASWRELLPLVRTPGRVERLMEEFYAGRPYTPVVLTELIDVDAVAGGPLPYIQVTALDENGRERLIGLERTPAGELRFDWELWVDMAAIEWGQFLDARPEQPTRLRVTVARSSPLSRYVTDAGVEADEARCFRIWLNDSGASLVAVFSSADGEVTPFWDDMSWDLGRRVIAELSFPVGAAEPDRVVFHRVVQPLWLIPEGSP